MNEEKDFLKYFKPKNPNSPGYFIALEDSQYMVSWTADSSNSVDEDGDDYYRQDFMVFNDSYEATDYYDFLREEKVMSNIILSVVVSRDQFNHPVSSKMGEETSVS